MAKEVLPIDQQLVENLRQAEINFETAKQALTDAQFAVYDAAKSHLPPKGTTHFVGVKISTGYNEKYDQEMLVDIQQRWNSNCKFPFKSELKAIASEVKYIKENAPTAYAELEKALTISDRKPTFELTDKE